MKNLFACVILALTIAACDQQSPTPAPAPAPSAPPAPAATMPATTPSAKATPVNKTCPVGNDPVDPAVATVMHEGKVIGFCCEDCVEPFKKDPAKYAANIK